MNKYQAFTNSELLALNGALRSRRADMPRFYNDNPGSERSIVFRMYGETNDALEARGFDFDKWVFVDKAEQDGR